MCQVILYVFSEQYSSCDMHYLYSGLPTQEMLVLKPTQTTKESKHKSGAGAVKTKSTSTAKVHTLKTTIGHNSMLEARDKAYEVPIVWHT